MNIPGIIGRYTPYVNKYAGTLPKLWTAAKTGYTVGTMIDNRTHASTAIANVAFKTFGPASRRMINIAGRFGIH